MHELTILSIIIFIIVLIIYLEYRNEKKYQEKRRKQGQAPTSTKQNTSPREAKKATPKAEPKPEPKIETKPEPEVKTAPEPEPKIETKKLPEADYPRFSHVRLVEMGLSDEEAKEFVAELIGQLEVETPLIEAAIQDGDFDKVERLTHGIKGSANNLGTGGVSDLLTDFNTYLRKGTDTDMMKAYLKHLVHYTSELKTQYT